MPTMPDVMSALDPHFDDIDAICRNAVARFQSYPADIRIELDKRAEASCIYAHMEFDASGRLTGKPGIVFKDIKGLKVWIVDDIAVIRFKKMDEDGSSRNYPTAQAVDYDRQLHFPGFPDPPLNLVAGYWLDPTGTEVKRVQIARPSGRRVDWCCAITPPGDRLPGVPRWTDVTIQARL